MTDALTKNLNVEGVCEVGYGNDIALKIENKRFFLQLLVGTHNKGGGGGVSAQPQFFVRKVQLFVSSLKKRLETQ